MKLYVFVVLIVFILSGCSSSAATPTSLPAPSQPGAATASVNNATRLPETAQPVATVATIATIAATPTMIRSGGLTFTLTSPADNAVVTTKTIDLVGSVSQDVVLSVNNDIFLLKAGNFKQPIGLDDGSNILQIVASNDAGDEVDLVLSVTYESD